MSKTLKPYGSSAEANIVAKVGKSKTPDSIAARLASAELVAKAGKDWAFTGNMKRQVVRRKRG